MGEQIGAKYRIRDNHYFSIQHMQRTGASFMPRPHTHPAYELYYLLQGERVYFMNGQVYTAQKGDMVVVLPNDLHSTASSSLAQFERVLINFHPDFLREGDRKVLEHPPFQESTMVRFSLKEQAEVERILLQILEECKEQPPLWESSVDHLLNDLLIRAHRSVHSIQSPRSTHPMHQKVTEIASFIHQHYMEPLSLLETAKTFYISPAYLSRIFLKLTGLHFSEYIRVVRIREAQLLLRSSKQKVQTIAEQVGFEHISHFNKAFKTYTGVPPLQYRKQNKR
ncbi:helix-turn-helix domain-containing protein [Paenibacillus puerhi]|uniref:helix-turn-helix domain-containing protein n=1 Tax=Paenibacillus puerhi TaxID=2692622 RepID=UPI00135A1D89|nr:AraC family transcriptional regulator [Paenibacillus puerhi]